MSKISGGDRNKFYTKHFFYFGHLTEIGGKNRQKFYLIKAELLFNGVIFLIGIKLTPLIICVQISFLGMRGKKANNRVVLLSRIGWLNFSD